MVDRWRFYGGSGHVWGIGVACRSLLHSFTHSWACCKPSSSCSVRDLRERYQKREGWHHHNKRGDWKSEANKCGKFKQFEYSTLDCKKSTHRIICQWHCDTLWCAYFTLWPLIFDIIGVARQRLTPDVKLMVVSGTLYSYGGTGVICKCLIHYNSDHN